MPPAFEAASVKPSRSGLGPSGRILPGRLVRTNTSLLDLIAFAYGVRTDQVAEGPSWMASDHYDIEATAAGNTPLNQIAGAMLQALLEDRFKLVLHRETRQLPVYELTVVRNGLKLQPMKEGSCTPFSPDSPPLPPGTSRFPFCGYPRNYGPTGVNWTLDGDAVSMGALYYEVHLKWTADLLGTGPSDDQSGPSIFTAVREQLGLRLESANGPVEVLVIDRAEKPSEN